MKVTTKELFNREYEITSIVIMFSNINDGEKGIFIMYVNDKANNILLTFEFCMYYTLFNHLQMVAIEDDEKTELLKEISKFKDEWVLAMKEQADNDNAEYLETEDVLKEWEEYNSEDDVTPFAYNFNNDSYMQIKRNDDGGYDVGINQVDETGEEEDDLKIASFNSFEEMLYGIAPFVQRNCEDEYEFGLLTSHLYYSFVAVDDDVEQLKDEIGEILMK